MKMHADAVRMINLLECLSEDHPEVPTPLDDEVVTWTEPELRAFFASGGAKRPEARDASLPGGTRALTIDARTDPSNAPVFFHDDASKEAFCDAANYRAAAFANGIPFRPNGLFPPNDALLLELASDATLAPFQKNVIGPGAAGEPRFEPVGSWAHGDVAAANGLDLRCFYRTEADSGVKFGKLIAAFRLGDRAGIGYHKWTTAHGGSIETVLDETTAELMKCAITADCATKELTAKISQPVRLHLTYRVECEIARHSSVQSWVTAAIFDPRDETVVASCEARMANLSAFTRMRQK